MNRQTIRNFAGGVLFAFSVMMIAGSFVDRAGAADSGCCGAGESELARKKSAGCIGSASIDDPGRDLS